MIHLTLQNWRNVLRKLWIFPDVQYVHHHFDTKFDLFLTILEIGLDDPILMIFFQLQNFLQAALLKFWCITPAPVQLIVLYFIFYQLS